MYGTVYKPLRQITAERYGADNGNAVPLGAQGNTDIFVNEYRDPIHAGGAEIGRSLHNLPNRRPLVNLSFRKLVPQSLVCSDVTPRSLRLHYPSQRPGRTAYVLGLLRGIGRRFSTELVSKQVDSTDPGAADAIFFVSWEDGGRS